MGLRGVSAWAAGEGTEESPLSGSMGAFNPDSYTETAGNTIYIDGITGGNFAQGSDNALTIVANINIGDGGMALTDAYSDTEYTFTGNISGTGNWTFNHSGAQKYVFTGSLADYSGNIDLTGAGTNSSDRPTYIHFGNGKTIESDTDTTNISGTGEVRVNGNVTFNYTDGDENEETSPTVKIGNAVIEATTLEFAGSVNYDVSSDLEGHTTSSTLTISNEGTTTLSGTVSNFSSITVGEGSTLVLASTATIGTIDNYGTVVLNEGVTFSIDGLTATEGSWSSSSSSDEVSVTYTLISGSGAVTVDDDILAALEITSSVHYVESATFTYADGVLTAEVTGLADGLHGEGSENNPYYTTGNGTIAIPVSGENSIFAGGSDTTVYLGTDEWALGSAAENVYWDTGESGGFTAECNIVIGKAGIYLTNGTSGKVHTFTGSISGTGDWTITSSGVNQDYIFTGDLSQWSGDFTITGTSDSYIYFGDGATVAATNDNVSGTGAVSVANGTIVFNYVKEDETRNTGPETVTIGNSSLTAANIEFAGSVNYVVSAGTTITGTSSSGAFTVSTEGAVTILGTFSNSTFGSLTVAENSTLKIGANNTFSMVSAGSDATLTISGALEIADGVNFTISKNYASTGYSIANLVLGDGSSLTLDTTGREYGSTSGGVPHESTTVSNDQGLAIGTLTVNGSATISTSTNHNYISIDTLIGEDATLYLGNTGQSIAATIYELKGNGDESSQFTGTIYLFEDYEGSNISYYQGVSLIISDEKIAAGAVIDMGYEYESGNGYTLALGVNASTVEIAGLKSDDTGANVIYSGAISSGANIGDGGAELADYKNHSDEFPDVGQQTNTLVINVADEESYSFTGNILDKVNIEKKGTGSQSITFQYNRWQTENFFDGSIVVTEGTLSLSSETGVVVTPGEITVAENATLNFTDITLELSSAIENSGSITFSDTTFVLDSLEGGYSPEYNVGYYEVVINSDGGSVDLSGSDFTFTFGGSELDGWNIVVADNGNVYIYGTVGDLIWAGTDPNSGGNNNWSTSADDKTWSAGTGLDNTYFINESGATFGAIGENSYGTVNVVGEVTASSTTVNDSYTFTTNNAEGAVLKTGTLTITVDGVSFVGGEDASLTVNIEQLVMSNSSRSITFSGDTTVTIGTYDYGIFYVKDGAVLDLSGASRTVNDGSGALYIDGGTVIVSNMAWGNNSNFGAAMYNNRLQISNGGVLEVTTAQAKTSSGARGFAVTEGEGTYRYSGETGTTSYITSSNSGDSNRTIHLGDGATLIFDVVNSGATLDVDMRIACGLGNDSDVGSSVSTSNGSLVKTGAGKLILSGTNLYSGGTKIQQGVLVAANSSALGTGTISIEGGQLSIDSGITISNTVNVTFSNAYQVVSGESTTGFYAIAGTGSLTDTGGVEITLFLDETMMATLISEGELYFALMETGVQSTYESDFSISLSEALSSYDYEYYVDTGVVRIFLPEPELFSVFFGISALGLMATRRRRRKVA